MRIVVFLTSLLALLSILMQSGCGIYKFNSSSTNARNISIQEFYNNTDLGPANLAQTFTNQLKDYFIQNTNLSVIQENGELQMEGTVSDYRVTQIAPTSTGDSRQITQASSSRLTITVKVTYINTLDESMSFKDKSFTFFRDFSNDQNLTDIEENLIRQIYDQIILDIFNASVANW